MPQAKLSDPSGRGKAEGFKVIFPMMQHPYTEAEIQAVVDVMRNAEGQTQGKYLEKFEKDFAAFGCEVCLRRKQLHQRAEAGGYLLPHPARRRGHRARVYLLCVGHSLRRSWRTYRLGRHQ